MAGRTSSSPGVKEAGLWHRLFGTDVHQHEANIYGQTVEDGGVVISVRVPESEVAHASAVLNIHRPVDVHDRAVTSGIAPAAHVEAVERRLAAVPLAAEQSSPPLPSSPLRNPMSCALRRSIWKSARKWPKPAGPRPTVRDRARSRPGRNPPRGACGKCCARRFPIRLSSARSIGRMARSRSSRLPSTPWSTRPRELSRKSG